MVEEVLLEELVALEVEVAEELVLVSAGGSESGEEHAERMRVRAAPKSRAGDLRGMGAFRRVSAVCTGEKRFLHRLALCRVTGANWLRTNRRS